MRKRLTQNAVPLQGACLGQIGYDTHTVSSFPAIIAAEIWVAATVEKTKHSFLSSTIHVTI